MVRTGTIPTMALWRARESFGPHAAAARRTGEAITTPPFWPPHSRPSFELASITGTSITIMVEFATTWWTIESFAIELSVARAGEAFTFKSAAFRAARESLAIHTSAARRTSKTLAIKAAPWRRAIEVTSLEATTFRTISKTTFVATAAFEPGTHRRSWTMFFESCISGWPARPATEPAAVGTSRAAVAAHMFMDGFSHRHEFIFAKLPVVVFIKLCKELGWVWRLRTATAFRTLSTRLATFASLLSRLLAVLFTATHLAHFFASLRAFLIVQLAIFIGIELFEHSLVSFSTAIVAFLSVLLWRLGECRQGQGTGRD